MLPCQTEHFFISSIGTKRTSPVNFSLGTPAARQRCHTESIFSRMTPVGTTQSRPLAEDRYPMKSASCEYAQPSRPLPMLLSISRAALPVWSHRESVLTSSVFPTSGFSPPLTWDLTNRSGAVVCPAFLALRHPPVVRPISSTSYPLARRNLATLCSPTSPATWLWSNRWIFIPDTAADSASTAAEPSARTEPNETM